MRSMKLNLLLNSNETLNNYINIHPFDDSNGKVKGDITKLDFVADDGECEEIRAIDILEYFYAWQTDDIIEGWVKKLRIGGKLILSFAEMYEVANNIAHYTISMKKANYYLFGKQESTWDTKKCSLSIVQMSQFLEGLGLKIRLKRIKDAQGIIIAERIDDNNTLP